MATSSIAMFSRLSLLLDDNEIPKPAPKLVNTAKENSKRTTDLADTIAKNLANDEFLKQDAAIKTSQSKQTSSTNSNSTTVPSNMPVITPATPVEDSSLSYISPSVQPQRMDVSRSLELAPCVGKLASPKQSFCPIMAMSKYPYKFVHEKELSEKIGEAFFTDGKFWRRGLDIYYIWAPNSSATKPLLLMRSEDAEDFLNLINEEIEDACLSLSRTAEFEQGLILIFDHDHPRLRPRYLGHTFSQEQWNDMSRNCHGESYRPPGEQPARLEEKADETALASCKLKVELGLDLCRQRAASKAARQQIRLSKQQGWRTDLRQVERFLGLRPESFQVDPSTLSDMSWDEYKAMEAKKKSLRDPPGINIKYPAPYEFESNVIFISIDIECYERDKRKVTEIGVSTLDTMDLVDLSPGPHGENWFQKIRSRHFRIKEYTHLENRDFVHGCAGDFRFGKSEFISLADAPKVLATCFRPPYSATDSEVDHLREEKRTIVLVGHDFANDLRYMQRLGYDVTNLSNLHQRHPIADTQGLYRALWQQWDAVKLGAILEEAEIAPFGLHNAGNDAAYTMQALLAIVIKSAGERGSKAAEKVRRAANKNRIAEQARLAIQRALEEAEGWSSPDDGEF